MLDPMCRYAVKGYIKRLNSHRTQIAMRTFFSIVTILVSTFLQAQPTGKPGERVQVADLKVLIPGMDTSATASPEFFYAFEAGDAVMLDITMDNAQGTNDLLVTSYPAGEEVYHDRAVPSMSIQRFNINERGIYRFTLSTDHADARNALIKVWRKPESAATQKFNCNVTWEKIYTTEQVCEQQAFFLNSLSNLNGNTRTALPVNLPLNTVEWYYRFSASREQAVIDRVSKNVGLIVEIGAALFTQGGSILASGFGDLLAQPPGADYCDIYLLDQKNYSPFISKGLSSHIADGTRLNFKSGNVRITCCPSGQYYLGIRNNDTAHGIHVFLDVVAITAVEDWVMAEQD